MAASTPTSFRSSRCGAFSTASTSVVAASIALVACAHDARTSSPTLSSARAPGHRPSLDVLPFLPSADVVPTPFHGHPMSTFEVAGYRLSGAEYWPYVGLAEPRYPEDVLWGFYPRKGVVPPGESEANPASATTSAIACATHAHEGLRAWLASDPPELRRVVALGAHRGYTDLFYLWVNDYSRADDPFTAGVRSARLWFWKRKTPDPAKPPGYWKWEVTLTQRGVCQLPDPVVSQQTLLAIHSELQ